MKTSIFERPQDFAIDITGVPANVSQTASALFASRLDRAARELIVAHDLPRLEVAIRHGQPAKPVALEADPRNGHEPSTQTKIRYACQDPLFNSSLLVLPATVNEQLDAARRLLELQPLLFDTWGLREIEPRPKSALNFHGPPGTGKTLAAHALASSMGKKILCASSADIESAFHGEGPKNVAELFRTAQAEDAVLFIDEADSLLSKRLTNITQGSEQAINSMRSQLLISLDVFQGLAVFATNLVSNYDTAFDTRVQHIHFPAPDRAARLELWRKHLPARLPVRDLSLDELTERSEGLVGRDIKTAVLQASIAAARSGAAAVSQTDLLGAMAVIRNAREEKAFTTHRDKI